MTFTALWRLVCTRRHSSTFQNRLPETVAPGNPWDFCLTQRYLFSLFLIALGLT